MLYEKNGQEVEKQPSEIGRGQRSGWVSRMSSEPCSVCRIFTSQCHGTHWLTAIVTIYVPSTSHASAKAIILRKKLREFLFNTTELSFFSNIFGHLSPILMLACAREHVRTTHLQTHSYTHRRAGMHATHFWLSLGSEINFHFYSCLAVKAELTHGMSCCKSRINA